MNPSQGAATPRTAPRRTALGAACRASTARPRSRGAGRYAMEQQPANIAHGVLVAVHDRGGPRRGIDTAAAEAAPGVLLVSHRTTPCPEDGDDLLGKAGGGSLSPADADMTFNGLHIALVVADTFEQATEAAASSRSRTMTRRRSLDLDDTKAGDGRSTRWSAMGRCAGGARRAPVRSSAEYTTPREYNVPMEPHGLIA